MAEIKNSIRQAYNEWADIYDSNENPTRDLNYRAVREAPLDFDRKNVLEIGCGTGLNTTYFAEKANQVTAVDFSGQMLKKARQRISQDNITFVEADITKPWSFKDESFDLVVGNLVLEHIQNLSPVFEETVRVLRGGGIFYIAELHPYKQLRQSQAKFVSRETGEEVLVDAFMHSVSEYVNKALSVGFTLHEMQEYHKKEEEIPRLLTLLFEKSG